MIRVLIADDSTFTREFIKKILEASTDIAVVGTATNGFEAVQLAKTLQPDVITMDIHMPGLDGLGATKKICADQNSAVLIVTKTIQKNMDLVFEAMSVGALDVVRSPHLEASQQLDQLNSKILLSVGNEMLFKIRVLSKLSAKKNRLKKNLDQNVSSHVLKRKKPFSGISKQKKARRIIAIGASTGGPSIIKQLLADCPTGIAHIEHGILIIQHLGETFTQGFADWLDHQSDFKVSLAENGSQVRAGFVLVAPGHQHLTITGDGTVKFLNREPINGYPSSVDVAFDSVAKVYGKRATGVLLTGMGADGAKGITHIKKMGGKTIAQNQESCVVFGMPKEAIALGGIDHILNPKDIKREMWL